VSVSNATASAPALTAEMVAPERFIDASTLCVHTRGPRARAASLDEAAIVECAEILGDESRGVVVTAGYDAPCVDDAGGVVDLHADRHAVTANAGGGGHDGAAVVEGAGGIEGEETGAIGRRAIASSVDRRGLHHAGIGERFPLETKTVSGRQTGGGPGAGANGASIVERCLISAPQEQSVGKRIAGRCVERRRDRGRVGKRGLIASPRIETVAAADATGLGGGGDHIRGQLRVKILPRPSAINEVRGHERDLGGMVVHADVAILAPLARPLVTDDPRPIAALGRRIVPAYYRDAVVARADVVDDDVGGEVGIRKDAVLVVPKRIVHKDAGIDGADVRQRAFHRLHVVGGQPVPTGKLHTRRVPMPVAWTGIGLDIGKRRLGGHPVRHKAPQLVEILVAAPSEIDALVERIETPRDKRFGKIRHRIVVTASRSIVGALGGRARRKRVASAGAALVAHRSDIAVPI